MSPRHSAPRAGNMARNAHMADEANGATEMPQAAHTQRAANAVRANRKARKIRRTMMAICALAALCAYAGAAWPYLAGYASMSSALNYRSEGDETAIFEPIGLAPALANEGIDEDIAWPVIDWEGLRAVNPNVVGWLYVPGTNIDYPLVQADESDPQHYLDYDLAGAPSCYGCPYLDADDASQGGLDAPFPVIYGHHLINGLMFSDFAKFSDEAYAQEHATMLLMTPDGNRKLTVAGANVVSANHERLQTCFANISEAATYLQACLAKSKVIIEPEVKEPFERAFCFVTCSYGSDNERTLVYATQAA